MRNRCLDEGTLQAYFDGQLGSEMIEHVVAHLGSCNVCQQAAQEAELEIELTSSAFASEMSLSVPSERLRTRIDGAIAGLNTQSIHASERTSPIRSWFVSLASTFNLSPQRAFGYASLVAVFVLAAVVGGIVMKQRGSESQFVAVTWNQDEPTDVNFDGPMAAVVSTPETGVKPKKFVRRAVSGPSDDNGTKLAHTMLPGEKNYLKAISVLTDAIEANGESSLKPTLLADYKRNLAVVDQAIVATQRTARSNRESADAAEMLYSVYQSKLDLLSAVAEQSRPMVAMR